MPEAKPKPGRGSWLIANATVFIASGCVMIIEIVAGRVVSQHLGQSLYTWTSIIGIILAGISVGNYLGGRLADRYEPRRTLAVMFIIGSATCLTIPVLNIAMGNLRLLWSFAWPARIVVHVAVTFIVPSVILGTISPLVAKMALASREEVGRTIGDIYACGAAGSIAGTFLAGFYLISWMGNTAVICVVAGVLAMLAVYYGFRMKGVYLWLVVYLAAFAAAFGPGDALASVGARLHLREPIDPDIRYLEESNYGRVMVREPKPGLRSMYLDKLLHTKVNLNDPLDLRYEYTWIYDAVTDALVPPGEPIHAMIIGGGGFAYPRYLELVRPGSYIEAHEIDPVVTKAAHEAMGLPKDTSIEIFNTDARHRIDDLIHRKKEGKDKDIPSFQVIYGDSINDYSVPYHLTTREFNEALYSLLDEEGAYILNLIDIGTAGHFLASIVTTCRATFPHVSVFSSNRALDKRDTFIVVCTKRPRDFSPVVEHLRKTRRFRGALLSEGTVQEIIDRARAVVLTDNFAPVENLLAEVVRSDRSDAVANYVAEAVKAAEAQDFDRAIRDFTSALEFSPDHPDLLYNLGLVYFQQGNRPEASRAFQRALEDAPTHFNARQTLGTLLMQNKQIEAAIEQWRILKRQYPGNAQVSYDLGHALASWGDIKAAAGHWSDAVRIEPSHARAHDSLGTVYSRAGDRESALRHYLLAVRHEPLRVTARLNLALEFMEMGRLEAAVAHLRIAQAQQPDLPAASNLLQKALLDMRNRADSGEKLKE